MPIETPPGWRPADHACRDCDFRTRWMLDLWEHRLRTGHMDLANVGTPR